VNQWQIIDPTNNLIFPYYTHYFLDELRTWDVSNWKVLEYGGGDSSLWWRDKTKECISIDTNEKWAADRDLILEKDKDKFINYPKKVVQESGELFDCIIIDGEPIEWRDECTAVAIECVKDGGMIIIDNWLQDSIKGLSSKDWNKSKVLLKDYESKVLRQHNHPNWKTAYWIITKK
jgi:hypothetical protein